MPTSGEMIAIVAAATNLAPEGVKTRFRVVREAGFLPSGGRGRSAAAHGLSSAVRLLVACIASDDVAGAASALQDASMLRPRAVLRWPLEGHDRLPVGKPAHSLTAAFFRELATTLHERPVPYDPTRPSPALTEPHRAAITESFFAGLPTARIQPGSHFGSVLAGVFEAVRDGTLFVTPSPHHYAQSARPPVEPGARFAEVSIGSRLRGGGWMVEEASIVIGMAGHWAERREFEALRGPREQRPTGPLRQMRSFDLALMDRLAASFPVQSG